MEGTCERLSRYIILRRGTHESLDARKRGDRGRSTERWRKLENGEPQGGEGRTNKRSMKEGYAGHAMVLTCAKYGTTRASSSRVH